LNRYAHITGWGYAVPDQILTNHDLSLIVDTSDEWIVTRTGIRERRIADKKESTASLATDASIRALHHAGVKPAEIQLIIVATSTPEHIFPATACLVQDQIGASKAGAFDLSAACSGFIYALDMATQAIRTGSLDSALVIGSETLSRFVDWADRNTCVLFGDGAGAIVLQASEEPGGVLSSTLHSDGSGGDLLILPAGGSKQPANEFTISQNLHTIQMNGREVFRFATRVLVQATQDAVHKAGLNLSDIHLIIPHQANQRIIDAATRGLSIAPERVFINVERYGNTSTASIPIAVCEAAAQGKLNPEDNVVFVGFGAGLTWGASVIRWSSPFLTRRKIHPARYRLPARLRSFLLRLLRKIEGWIWGNWQ